MRRFYAAAWWAVLVAVQPADGEERPNFIVITTDDQRWDAAGFAGNKVIRTPALDAFAQKALRFTDAHVVFALCGPSRAAILSGQYGSRNGVMDFSGRMEAPESSLAARLRKAGYDTAVCGKWHLKASPAQCGFSWAVTFQGNGTYFGRVVNRNGETVRPPELVDAYCANESVRYLRERSAGRPFFLWHCTQLPHMDGKRTWPASEASLAKYKAGEMPLPVNWNDNLATKPPYLRNCRNRRVAHEEYGYRDPVRIREHAREYYAVMSDLDAALQPLFAEIGKEELLENTYVFFHSDNGWFLGQHGFTSKMIGYEDASRVPFLAAGPGITPGRNRELVLNIDLAPTILDLAELGVPETMQGRSLAPTLLGVRALRRPGFVYEGLGIYADLKPHLGYITRNWRYLETPRAEDGPFRELYDRELDPPEVANLARRPDTAGIVEKGRRAIDAHRKQIKR